MISNKRSKPTVDRQRGVGSKVLIATSSVEQHGYEGRPKRRRPWDLPTPEWAIGNFDLGSSVSPSRAHSPSLPSCDDSAESLPLSVIGITLSARRTLG